MKKRAEENEKVLVLYDSLYGNTEKIARAVGKGLGVADSDVVKATDFVLMKLSDVTFLVVGSPTHGGRPSEKLQSVLKDIPEGVFEGMRVATFDTSISVEGQSRFIVFIVNLFGYAAKRIASMFEAKGAAIVGSETFFVLGKEGPLKDGEEERAEKWARGLSKKV